MESDEGCTYSYRVYTCMYKFVYVRMYTSNDIDPTSDLIIPTKIHTYI